MNGVQTRLKCKPNVKRCKRFVFAAHSPLLHPNTLKTKAIIHFQTDHILTRFVFPPLYIMNKKNIDSLESLRTQAIQNGVEFIACQMSMDVMGVKREELLDHVTIGGVATYMNRAEQANVNLFI